jgi:hypothetical protein
MPLFGAQTDSFLAHSGLDHSKPTRAVAFDEGKLDLNIIPPEFIEMQVGPFTSGIAKGYARDNWKQSLNTEEHDTFVDRRMNSLQRHTLLYRKGERVDPETGLSHMLLAQWNAGVVAWYEANDRRAKPLTLDRLKQGVQELFKPGVEL